MLDLILVRYGQIVYGVQCFKITLRMFSLSIYIDILFVEFRDTSMSGLLAQPGESWMQFLTLAEKLSVI